MVHLSSKVPGSRSCPTRAKAASAHPFCPPLNARGGGATPQAFHHGVNHDKSGYDVASDRRLLRAAMVGLTTALSTRFNLCENCYMEIENLFRYPALAVGLKPSASQGEAHLRGLERIICSKTI